MRALHKLITDTANAENQILTADQYQFFTDFTDVYIDGSIIGGERSAQRLLADTFFVDYLSGVGVMLAEH